MQAFKRLAWEEKEGLTFDGNEEIWWSRETIETMWWLRAVWKRQLRGWAQKSSWEEWREIESGIVESSLCSSEKNLERSKWTALALTSWFLKADSEEQKHTSWSFKMTKYGDLKNSPIFKVCSWNLISCQSKLL